MANSRKKLGDAWGDFWHAVADWVDHHLAHRKHRRHHHHHRHLKFVTIELRRVSCN